MAIKLHADSYSQADVFLPRDGAVNVIPHNKNDGLAVEGLLLESGSGNLVGRIDQQRRIRESVENPEHRFRDERISGGRITGHGHNLSPGTPRASRALSVE